jgi:plastocyanin
MVGLTKINILSPNQLLITQHLPFYYTLKKQINKKLMKKAIFCTAISFVGLLSCNKSGSGSSITLTTSSSEVSVGQTLTVTANTNANALSWSATPAASTSKTYDVTTEKTNYFTFSQPGAYVIGVRARGLDLDSTHKCNHADSIGHHLQDSLWNHHIDSLWHTRGNHRGECRNGQDSASVVIMVK